MFSFFPLGLCKYSCFTEQHLFCVCLFLFASGALTLGYLNINLPTERRVLISEEQTCYSGLRYALFSTDFSIFER